MTQALSHLWKPRLTDKKGLTRIGFGLWHPGGRGRGGGALKGGGGVLGFPVPHHQSSLKQQVKLPQLGEKSEG